MDQNAKAQVLQLTPKDLEDFFTELNLQNLPDDRKQVMMDTAIDTIMDRIFLRIAPVLTEKDQLTLEDLEKKNNAPDEMLSYLLSVIPNFAELVKEEVYTYKFQLKTQMAEIMNTLDKEAQKVEHHVEH